MQFAAAIVSFVLYSSHVPERLWPRRFDVVGQSHQLFHLSAFAMTMFQSAALRCDMRQLIDQQATTAVAAAAAPQSATTHILVVSSVLKSVRYSQVPIVDLSLSHTLTMVCCLAFNALIVLYYYKKLTRDYKKLGSDKQQHLFVYSCCCGFDDDTSMHQKKFK